MPKKILSTPPEIPKEAIKETGEVATITELRLLHDQWTNIGTQKLALGITVDVLGGEYSQMFSLDAKQITGSLGRILTDAGITELPDAPEEELFKPLIGKQYIVKNKQGKLYWYPQQS